MIDMGDDELRKMQEGAGEDCAGGGYSILMNENAMLTFIEEGDLSSARDLDHFRNMESQIVKRLKEDGTSLLALSAGGKRISRDFAVLQLAHLFARRGKKVLIVDCDFLEPGLSGIVENVEELGFLDLLLYGSSLKSVMRHTGIDGVSVTGAGSFPVTRTIPFAQKEFAKIRDFLAKNNDIVIYCTTLHTEEGNINPLADLVDSVLLCCRIEEMEEGQLQQHLKELGSGAQTVDLICFCEAKGQEAAEKKVPAKEEVTVSGEPEKGPEESFEDIEEIPEPEALEISEEIDAIDRPIRRGLNIGRLVIGVSIALIVVFIVWWYMVNRSIREKEETGKLTELVQKQQDVRDKTQGREMEDGEVPEETAEGEGAQGVAGETTEGETAVQEEPAAGDAGQDQAGTGEGEEASDAAGKEVTEQPAEAEQVPEETGTPAPEGSYYSIHIASFRDMTRAGSETDYLEKSDFEVKVIETQVRGETWYRVYVGEFKTKEEAEKARRELLSLSRIGYAMIVTLKYN